MYVDRHPETYDCFQAGFFTWFNQQNVVYNPFERIKKFFRIMPAEYDSYDMVDCFLFAKYMSIIGKGIFSLSENDVNTLHYVDSIRDSDMTLLAISLQLADGWYRGSCGAWGLKTTFAVFGFRYALVETEAEFKAEDFTAIAVYSDMEQTGFFESSDELLNNLFEATVWSAKGNHLDIPTDCPTRERHGWTGDAQIFFETAAYMFDFAAFSNKYLHDVYDLQSGNGKLPQIAPAGGVDKYMNAMNGSVGWSDVGILIPYRFWKVFGDESMIREFYDRMARYARFMEKRCGIS